MLLFMKLRLPGICMLRLTVIILLLSMGSIISFMAIIIPLLFQFSFVSLGNFFHIIMASLGVIFFIILNVCLPPLAILLNNLLPLVIIMALFFFLSLHTSLMISFICLSFQLGCYFFKSFHISLLNCIYVFLSILAIGLFLRNRAF